MANFKNSLQKFSIPSSKVHVNRDYNELKHMWRWNGSSMGYFKQKLNILLTDWKWQCCPKLLTYKGVPTIFHLFQQNFRILLQTFYGNFCKGNIWVRIIENFFRIHGYVLVSYKVSSLYFISKSSFKLGLMRFWLMIVFGLDSMFLYGVLALFGAGLV